MRTCNRGRVPAASSRASFCAASRILHTQEHITMSAPRPQQSASATLPTATCLVSQMTGTFCKCDRPAGIVLGSHEALRQRILP